MVLVVEDGSGLATADALVSEAFVDTWITNYRSAADLVLWNAADKELSIRDATLYAGQKYGSRWCGYRANSVQSLDWPRANVRDRDGYLVARTVVPLKVKQACAELAFLSATESKGLWANQALPGTIKSKMVKAGPVATKVEYGGGSQTKKFPRVDGLLSEFIESSSLLRRG